VEVLLEEDKKAFERHKVPGMPVMLILTSEGREVGRFGGFHPPDKFIEKLNECRAVDVNLAKAAKLLDENPKNAEGLYLRAVANLYRNGKEKEAFKDLDILSGMALTEQNKIHVFKAIWKLAQTSGVRFEKRMAAKERNKYLETLVKKDEKNESGRIPEALYLLGLSSLRDAAKMKQYFDKARKTDPQNKSGFADDIAFVEALAPYYSKNYASAATNLKGFIDKFKESNLVPQAYAKLALCQYRAKEKQKTMETLEKLIKEFPESREAGPARKWLEKLKKK
jgi:outer membrane protein assembly factor BamD (BamD/ComL family)